MIAGPDPARILVQREGRPATARIDEVGDADLAGSWDRFRVRGPGTRVIEAGGRRLISIVTPLAHSGRDWHLVITVPEDEFSGFVTTNSRRAAALSLVVVALAAGLGGLLVRQGLRADRADRAVAERSEEVRRQSAAFARLAREAGMFDAAGTPPRALTETLAEATGARRAGLWRLVNDGQALRCEDSFEPATGGHVAGLELSRQEVPALLEALARGEEIDAPDARRDRRTAALYGSLMAPLGSTALFAVPVMQAGRGEAGRSPLGLLMLEDSRREPAARDLIRACATLVALCTQAGAPPAPAAGDAPAAVRPGAPEEGLAADERGLDAALAAHGLAVAGLAIEAHPHAAVLVLRLPGVAMARARPADPHEAAASPAHAIACAAQEVAAAHGIAYVKMLGTSIVAADGLGAADAAAAGDAARRLADMAIALRARCAALFEAVEGPAEFGLGLDCGLVFGGRLGEAPGLFNLWGEAVQGAEALAGSAPAGAIQASEPVYRVLRRHFLFRPRGLFHRPRIGDQRSYVLAGRA